MSENIQSVGRYLCSISAFGGWVKGGWREGVKRVKEAVTLTGKLQVVTV